MGPQMKKARRSKFKFKALLIVFFDIKDYYGELGSQTVNQYYHRKFCYEK